ncbi:hypothetical protein P3G55_07140 [Leptospira sp. 96542]|nr:hypothetical protein [Leptospira sp. 96542]
MTPKFSFKQYLALVTLLFFTFLSILFLYDPNPKKQNEFVPYDTRFETSQSSESMIKSFEYEGYKSLGLEDAQEFSDEMLLIPSILDSPFQIWIVEAYESLKNNYLTPNPNQNHLELVKTFHNRLDFLKEKTKLEGLSLTEKEELRVLQLRKQKDLREVMAFTLEKYNGRFSPEQRKSFESELESLDQSIHSLIERTEK